MFKFRCLGALGLLAISAVGCASQADAHQRLLGEQARAERSALEQQLRIAELELRLQQLEARRAPMAAAELAAILERLDTVIAQNQALLRAQGTPGAAAAVVPTGDAPSEDADAKVMLRYWAERLRAGSNRFRSGLTPEQSAALNTLLRRERPLDPRNPWQEL
jgi:type II secretory pathway pseudopilin PulG